MAGVKGRSGGARPGAGRKAKTADPATTEDSKEFLTMAMQGRVDPSPAQLKAAIALLAIQHARKGDVGKKEEKNEAAKRVANRFTRAAPPQLVAAGGKKV